jgi:PAS domain S-box-containing protein
MSGAKRESSIAMDERTLQRLEHDVALILAQTASPVETYRATLEAIGRRLGWAVGAVWEVDGEVLHCVLTWHAATGAPRFEALSEEIGLGSGVGLPGRVWETGEPAWVVDAPRDPNFPRASAAAAEGLHAAMCFPLPNASGVAGVMEFFAHELREPDERLLASLTVIGSQIGQVVARRRAQAETAAAASRLQAMLEAALDAVVTIDHDGIVRGWNHAAEEIFGYRAAEAVGSEMAELIVPPSLRDTHRAGLARFLETGRPVVLDRRIEITGLHASGHEFPVELAITQIDLPGDPVFTGYLRDITDRKAAEAALRASRARLVEVAETERRRIQRNLHDGAQQRLTSTLLALGRLRQSVDADEAASTRLDGAIDELTEALHELRELANGMHPPILSERGLGEALRALALRTPVPVDLVAVPHERLPAGVEATAYYVVSEALANVDKHAQARRVEVRAALDRETLAVDVTDDGVGGARLEGTGLLGLVDRVEAIGGTLEVTSPPREGTMLRVRIPIPG